MVNCKNCGAPLSLNDAYCPHCGTPNPEAQEHLKKLKQLDAKMENARQEVTAEVKKSKKGYGLLIVLAMLLFANLAVFILHSASYEIADSLRAKNMSEAEVRQQLDSMLEKGEYVEMDIFMNKYSLPYSKYSDYQSIAYLASSYSRIQDSMSRYLYAKDPYDDPLMKVCEYVVDYADEYKNLKKRDNSELVLYHMERLNDEVKTYMRYYLKLTDEDIAGLGDMASSGLLILVNERMNNEK